MGQTYSLSQVPHTSPPPPTTRPRRPGHVPPPMPEWKNLKEIDNVWHTLSSKFLTTSVKENAAKAVNKWQQSNQNQALLWEWMEYARSKKSPYSFDAITTYMEQIGISWQKTNTEVLVS